MGRKKIHSTLTWEDAPDTITPEILSKILGCCEQKATEYFNEKDFPRLDKIGLKADKEAARMFLQGFRVKQNQKLCIEQMMLLELRRLNNNVEEGRIKFNEQKAI